MLAIGKKKKNNGKQMTHVVEEMLKTVRNDL